jgi:rRNA maturation RNase YbeY
MDIKEEFSFYSEQISFELKRKPAIKSWLSSSIKNENKIPGEISYIFCSDEYLNEVNIKHLNHDTYTDIITFDYCENKLLNGDLFISLDRIKENAHTYKSSVENELHRVMIHGIMHLCGYEDKTPEDQNVMSAKEDFYLNLRNF